MITFANKYELAPQFSGIYQKLLHGRTIRSRSIAREFVDFNVKSCVKCACGVLIDGGGSVCCSPLWVEPLTRTAGGAMVNSSNAAMRE
jgi:hypothetical protein